MSQFVLKAPVRAAALEEGQGALSRETLQATGFYMGRVVIATAEFAPMPPLHLPGLPRRFHSDGHRDAFSEA